MRKQVLFAGIAATALAAGLGFVVVNSLTDSDSDPDTRTDTSNDPSTDDQALRPRSYECALRSSSPGGRPPRLLMPTSP